MCGEEVKQQNRPIRSAPQHQGVQWRNRILWIVNGPVTPSWRHLSVTKLALGDPDLFLSPAVTQHSHNQVITLCLCDLMDCYSGHIFVLCTFFFSFIHKHKLLPENLHREN